MLPQIVRRLPFIRTVVKLLKSARQYASYLGCFRRFQKLASERVELSVLWHDRYPCLGDNTGTTGFDRHYIYHTSWAARILAETRPAKHTDISSSLYFCTIASAFVPIEFYDYRPAEIKLSNLVSRPGDLLHLPFADNSVSSLSCMHVVEHVGLGRYGDPLDVRGDLKAISELVRVLAEGGTLLFVVPVGKPRIMFNAHRIYSYEQIAKYFEGLELVEFSLIPDDAEDGGLLRDAPPGMVAHQDYACGCFLFKKIVHLSIIN